MKKNGIHKTYYKNGQLEYETNFKDGEEDEVRKYWEEDGQLRSKTKWTYRTRSNN